MNREKPKLYSLKVIKGASKHNFFYIDKQQLALFGFERGQKLSLQIGFTELAVEVAELQHDAPLTTLYLSEATFAGLTHYHGEQLWLALLSQNKMILGPTMAITVSASTWKNIDKIYAIKKRALLALEKGIFFYCFHLSKVDLDNNLLEAYYFDPHQYKFIKKFLPFPQVLYHRASFPFPYYAKQADPDNIYYKLWANPRIQKINTTYGFDKWTAYQALSNSRETGNFQPETVLLSRAAIEQFLSKYPSCYLKNIYGRGGRQILQVKKDGLTYSCKTGGNKVRHWHFEDQNELFPFLREKLGENLILQQGITLARLDNRPFDIRVLVQKNMNAEWVITALSFRVAATEAVVTNVAAGATEIALAPGDNLLGCGLSLDTLKDFTLKTLAALEAFYGSLGEVGLDIGLDNDGRPWLFEANSQPSSRGYKEAATAELCDQIFGLPLDYAKYLARRMFKELDAK